MNILGIGPAELIIVLVLMLIVAGPQRMIRWAYEMGKYTAKFRAMWQETTDVLRSELESAGIEPEVVDTLGQMANPRTRNASMTKQLGKLVEPFEEGLKPVDEALKSVGTTTLLATSDTASDDTPAEDASSAGASESSEPTPGRYDAWTPN